MNHRAALATLNSINGRIQHCVDEICIGMSPNRPAHHQPVKAINDWRQVNLASRNLEFSNVGEPLLIGRSGTEVSIDEVLRGGTYLSKVGVISAAFGLGHDQPLLLHQPTNHLL